MDEAEIRNPANLFGGPMNEAVRRMREFTRAARLPATGAHLLGLVDWGWHRLAGSIDTAAG